MKSKLLCALVIAILGVALVAWITSRSPSPPSKPYGICQLNLKVITAAKQLWAEELHRTTNDPPPTFDDLSSLTTIPTCPCGGTYTLGRVGQDVKCSLTEAEHTWARKPAHDESSVPTPGQPGDKIKKRDANWGRLYLLFIARVTRHISSARARGQPVLHQPTHVETRFVLRPPP